MVPNWYQRICDMRLFAAIRTHNVGGDFCSRTDQSEPPFRLRQILLGCPTKSSPKSLQRA